MNPSYSYPMHCRECGQLMEIDPDGISHHLTPDGEIDHDADADHVAVDDEGKCV